MAEDARNLPGELLRQTMRHWATGVTIVSSQHDGRRHGMTVNSFTSISLEPPLVTVTLANDTRTHDLVRAAGRFGVSILAYDQAILSDIFSGRVADGDDRFQGVDTFDLNEDIPLVKGALAALVCRVVHTYPLPHSTVFFGEVLAAWQGEGGEPLIYLNRGYHRIDREIKP